MFHSKFLALPLAVAASPWLVAFSPYSAPAVARQVARSADVRRDTSLDEAARLHATDILQDRNRARWERVKQALRREGVSDAQFWPVAVVGSDQDALLTELSEASAPLGREKGATHVGIGVARRGPMRAFVALFVRRLVRLSPLPRRPASRGLTVRGTTDKGRHLEALWMGPCRDTACQGGVIALPVRPGRAGWSVELPPMAGAGTWTLELMVETERGPEPASLWRFGDKPRLGGRPRGSPEQWVANFRTRADLAPLRADSRLTSAARRHAKQVCANRFAAHVLPDGEDPTHRVRDAGYFGHVTENVAVAPTVAGAHRDLLLSPSHRRNLLDPAAIDYGLAVAQAPAQAGTRPIFCWVELFGHPDR